MVFKKGQKAWNVGLTKENNEIVKKIGEKCSKTVKEKGIHKGKNNSMYGKRGLLSPLYGRPHTKETKRKQSEGLSGKPKSKEHCINMGKSKRGKPLPPLTEEHKRKIGDAQLGEKSHNWKGGTSFQPYGIEFNRRLREQIRKRDNYYCQECGINQNSLKRRLHVHHIDENKLNCNLNNLISLCYKCHEKTIYEKDKDWVGYYQVRMELRNMNILDLQEPEDIILEMVM